MLCNILTSILRPNFEEPIDTVKQLVEKNITLYFWPMAEDNRQFLIDSQIPEYKILGENAIMTDTYDQFQDITAIAIAEGTHAQMTHFVDSIDLEIAEENHPEGKGWYRSKEFITGKIPFAGYLTSKKWHLNEV